MSESLFINSVYKANLNDIYKLLSSNTLNIYKCHDSRGMNALHIASLNGNLSVIKFLLAYSKKAYKSSELLINWANEKSEEGFTPAHFAAFRGHTEILKELLSIGADSLAKNHQGLTLMHVAAQGDQSLVLVYLKTIGLDPCSLDNKSSLPMHWAAYMGCETSAAILLAWGCNTSIQDEDGHTPLHLATMAGNSRIVRNLLIKGADRGIKDKKGETPLDIAIRENHKNLIHLLREVKLIDECCLRPPLRKPKPSYLSLISFIMLFCGGTALNLIFRTNTQNYTTYVYGILIFLADLFFLLLINKNPGYLKPKPGQDLLKLYTQYDTYLVCPDCEVYRPARSRHCQSCDKCVEKFDHHCPWVNNCIGAKNLGFFFTFINFVWFSLLSTIALNVYALSTKQKVDLISIPYEADMALSILFIILAFVFAIPVSFLLTVHYKNFISNRTTNERFGKGGPEIKNSVSTVSFDASRRGCFVNFLDMCCNTTRHERINEEKPSSPSVDSNYYEIIEKLKSED